MTATHDGKEAAMPRPDWNELNRAEKARVTLYSSLVAGIVAFLAGAAIAAPVA